MEDDSKHHSSIMKKLLVLLTLLSHPGCGRPMISERIVGGADAAIEEWPWQVTLQIEGFGQCGGSLITNSWVLTAAHCFQQSENISDYTVYLGVYQLSNLQNPGIVGRGLKQIIVNPNFLLESGGDIALIEMDKPVNLTSSIRTICLPSASVNLSEGTLCWATGWGNIQDGVPLPNPKTLQEVQLALIDNKNCESMYQTSLGYNPKYKLIQSDMMCAGYKEGKKDTCQGDSGGPLVCSVNGVWVQMGVISFGLGCAEPSHPGVYTRVQYYLSWIQTYVTSLKNGLNNVHLGQNFNTTLYPDNSSLSNKNPIESGNVTDSYVIVSLLEYLNLYDVGTERYGEALSALDSNKDLGYPTDTYTLCLMLLKKEPRRF
ncbi:serine protease 33-like [Hyla sarda]|uniref:serine protease 33-like n=1 Tax=Hyla sarda TaxID=327740 RepID=UPI0024C3B189|nr:serine protease 33-like [Hyla sarda]